MHRCRRAIWFLLIVSIAAPVAGAYARNTDLHQAIRDSNDKDAIQFIRKGKQLSKPDRDGNTPLHVAAAYGRAGITELLLSAGVDPDVTTKDDRRFTALHLLAQDGYHVSHHQVARLLLAKSAQVDARSTAEQTPLHVAARIGRDTMAAILTEHGARIDAVDEDGLTPLMHASAAGKPSLVAFLLSHNANAHHTAADGQTALHKAAATGRKEIVADLLAHGADPLSVDAEGNASLHVALLNEQVEAARALIAGGAIALHKVDTTEDRYATALAYQLAAERQLATGETEGAMKLYRIAESEFRLASQEFEEASERALTKHKVGKGLAIAGTVAAIVVASKMQDEYQSSTHSAPPSTSYYVPPPPSQNSKVKGATRRYGNADAPGKEADTEETPSTAPVAGMHAEALYAAKMYQNSRKNVGSADMMSMGQNAPEKSNEDFVEDATQLELAAFYKARSKHSYESALFCGGITRCQELLKPGESLDECVAEITAAR